METEEPLTRAKPALNPVRLLRWGFLGGYVLVLVLLPVRGAGEAMLLWAVAPLPVYAGGWEVYGGWRLFGESWALRTRGITVEGRLVQSFATDSGMKHVYTYVDS